MPSAGRGGCLCHQRRSHGGHWSSSDPPERDDQVDGDDEAADDREDGPRTAKSPQFVISYDPASWVAVHRAGGTPSRSRRPLAHHLNATVCRDPRAHVRSCASVPRRNHRPLRAASDPSQRVLLIVMRAGPLGLDEPRRAVGHHSIRSARDRCRLCRPRATMTAWAVLRSRSPFPLVSWHDERYTSACLPEFPLE